MWTKQTPRSISIQTSRYTKQSNFEGEINARHDRENTYHDQLMTAKQSSIPRSTQAQRNKAATANDNVRAERRPKSSLNQAQGQVKYRPESRTPESSPSAQSEPEQSPSQVTSESSPQPALVKRGPGAPESSPS